GLADRQGAAVHRTRRRSRGSVSHRPAEPPRAARQAARQDDGDRAHDRRQSPWRGEGGEGAAAATAWRKPGTSLRDRAPIHHARDARRQGGGRIPRVHCPQGKAAGLMAIKYEKRDGVAYITLNNPEKANIFDKETSDAISEAWIDMWEDRAIRCAIL